MKRLIVNENSPKFNTSGMNFKSFASDINNVRKYAVEIIKNVSSKYREINLLEQQISEIIKNAIKHGNKCNPEKKVKVWFKFYRNKKMFRMIVEDEGSGFTNLENWNKFYEKRNYYFKKKDYKNMFKYISYKTSESNKTDGGNALFAAIEYWNGGIVYNNKKNKVVVTKIWR